MKKDKEVEKYVKKMRKEIKQRFPPKVKYETTFTLSPAGRQEFEELGVECRFINKENKKFEIKVTITERR